MTNITLLRDQVEGAKFAEFTNEGKRVQGFKVRSLRKEDDAYILEGMEVKVSLSYSLEEIETLAKGDALKRENGNFQVLI